LNQKYNRMPSLQILIATYGESGLERLSRMDLPPIDGVEYLVSCQYPKTLPNIPSSLIRNDLKIHFSKTIGLSKNRNILLRLATAELCMIADDDICFIESGVQSVREIFNNNPTLDVASFRYTDEYGNTEKRYPEVSFDLKQPAKGFFISSIELAFRLNPVKQSQILFNENFGVGSTLYACGEEELWLHDLLNAGLNGRYFPITIAIHHGATTGVRRMGDPAVLRAQGAVIIRLYPITSFLRILLKAWRSSRSTKAGFLFCLRYLMQGWAHGVLFHRRLFNR